MNGADAELFLRPVEKILGVRQAARRKVGGGDPAARAPARRSPASRTAPLRIRRADESAAAHRRTASTRFVPDRYVDHRLEQDLLEQRGGPLPVHPAPGTSICARRSARMTAAAQADTAVADAARSRGRSRPCRRVSAARSSSAGGLLNRPICNTSGPLLNRAMSRTRAKKLPLSARRSAPRRRPRSRPRARATADRASRPCRAADPPGR